MKAISHFLYRNRTRVFVWVAALVATIPTGLWCGSKTWHGLKAFFDVTTLHGEILVLGVAVFVTFGVVVMLQTAVKEILKKLF